MSASRLFPPPAPTSHTLSPVPWSPGLLTHTDASVAQVGRHNEAAALVDTHAHESSVHASDKAAYAHNNGHQGATVIAEGGGC